MPRARRCLDELEADHFHWEFVKRAMTMAFDKRPREVGQKYSTLSRLEL